MENKEKLPIYRWTIDPNDKELGMKAISVVDYPAMESSYLAFSRENKPKIFKFNDGVKKIIAGLALIPEKLIYRYDMFTGEEYYGYFDAEAIEMIADKFMKESILNDVNFNHDPEDKTNAYLVESFIIRTPEMVEAMNAWGITDAVIGAWYVAYKFKYIEDYERAVNDGFTGFSIEAYLDRELQLKKINSKNKNNIMSKVNELINKFKTLLNEFEGEEAPVVETPKADLEDVKTADGAMTLRYAGVGEPVYVVTVDEAGTETTETAPKGDYMLEGGNMLVVDENGNLAEIKEAKEGESPVEPVTPDDMNQLAKEELKKYEPIVSLLSMAKDGGYDIKVVLKDGAVETATLTVDENQLLKQVKEKDSQIESLKAENSKFKTELQKHLNKSVTEETSVEVKKTLSSEEIAKLSNADRVKYRLGIK